MCGVNLTSFGCEEKILSKEHIVQWSQAEPCGALWSYVEPSGVKQRQVEPRYSALLTSLSARARATSV